MKKFRGSSLNGYYIFDEQGVRGERVEVVKDGILKNFLMTRTGLDGFPKSNGHSRAEFEYDPTSRQSNLIVETNSYKTDAELRKILIEEAKKQAEKSLAGLKNEQAELGSNHAKVIGSYTSRLNGLNQEMTLLQNEWSSASSERKAQINSRLAQIQTEKNIIQAELENENKSYQNKCQSDCRQPVRPSARLLMSLG